MFCCKTNSANSKALSFTDITLNTLSIFLSIFDSIIIGSLKLGLLTTKTTSKPDKTSIKKALKNGDNVAGAELDHSYSLQINEKKGK